LTVVQIVFFLGVGVALGLDLTHIDPLGTLVFLVLTVLAMSPIGVLSAASIMVFKQEAPTAYLVGGLASLLGGVLFPVSRLPFALQILSWMLPITHSLNGLRGSVEGATLWQLRGDALWLAGLTLILLPVSLYVFGRAIRRAKMDGTLGDY
jgi:ABC-2 type transport system permease protein